MAASVSEATQHCERLLREDRQYNVDRKIWPSQNRVIDHLLARRAELPRAYEEIYGKLKDRPNALNEFFRALLFTAALWGPERIAELRRKRDRLVLVNEEIGTASRQLAALLEERAELQETSGFRCGTYYHVAEVIAAASGDNHHFRMYLREPLQQLRRQYDLKYWPSIAGFVSEIADDAALADVTVDDPLTEAATSATRASQADFFKALFAAVDDGRVRNHGWIPDDFGLTDDAIASLANCALDLGPDEGVDAPYVKRLRQRERKKGDTQRPAA